MGTAYSELQCGQGYYVMHDKCYAMPSDPHDKNNDLVLYEPVLTKQNDMADDGFRENERTFVTTVIRNTGDESQEFKLSMRYMKAVTAEWSDWKFANSMVNSNDHQVIGLPFLPASDVKDLQLQVKLEDKNGNLISTINSTPTAKIINDSPPSHSSNNDFTNTLVNSGSIPSWVKGIFVLYAEGKLNDNELKEAIRFLIQTNVIVL